VLCVVCVCNVFYLSMDQVFRGCLYQPFEFDYILNLYVLSMCFVCYRSWVICTLCNVAPMLFFQTSEIFDEKFGIPLAHQVHTLQYHLFVAKLIQKFARSLCGYSP
jgi:hypothetical protein